MRDLIRGRRASLFMAAGVVALIVVAIIGWQAIPVDHLAAGHAEHSFVLECDFGKFRQIMVRKNATQAIVGHSGMTLLNDQVEDIELDASRDDRPLLNAIRGTSKTDVSATKELTVKLDDPQLEADRLVLRQNADIREHKIDVSTLSKGPAGRLRDYATTLNAEPSEGGTLVTLSVDLHVLVAVPRAFTGRADQKVQQAADDAITEQAIAIEEFVTQHAGERFILPELGR